MSREHGVWEFADRHYRVLLASTPDSMDLELDDVGPGVGRGLVATAKRSDGSESVTLQSFTSDPLPLDLVDRFVSEARRRLAM